MKPQLLLPLLLSATNALAQPPAYIPVSGLVAWYPFNGNATDESGNGHDLAVNGAALTDDRNAQSSAAYFFDGTGAHMNGGSHPDFEVTGDRTISAWIAPGAMLNDDQGIVGCIGSSGSLAGHAGYYLKRRLVEPDIIAAYEDSALLGNGNYGAAFSDGPAIVGEWHHLVHWRSGGTTRLYVDGMLQTSSYSLTPYFLNSEFLVGWSGSSGQYFNGAIDDIGFWDRALDPAEIQAVFQANSMEGCLIAHYPFEGNAADVTGNGHNGVIIGNPVLVQGPDGSACYQFDGVDDYISLGGTWGGLNGTVTAWIFPDELGQYNPIFSRRDTTVNGSALELVVNINAQPDSSKLYKASDFRECQPGALYFRNSVIEIQAGVWSCVAMTANDLGTSLFINGQEVATYGDPDPGYWFDNMCPGSINTYIGMSSRPLNTWYFKGRIDDVRVYDCALTPAEIVDLCPLSTAVAAHTPGARIEVFPNPTTGMVSITGLDASALTWYLTDALGRSCRLVPMRNGSMVQVDLGSYPAGLYVIQAGAQRFTVVKE